MADGGLLPDNRPRSPSPAFLAELPDPFALTAAVHELDAVPESDTSLAHLHPTDDGHSERGLRGLVGGGSSQVGVVAAMRARDASRPTDADLARAAEKVVVIRRGWVPREDLPRPNRH